MKLQPCNWAQACEGALDTAHFSFLHIEFRRLMLRGARAVRAGIEPDAARNGAGYRVRGGSIVADRALAFADVMVKRFGGAAGRVTGEPRGDHL